MRNYTENLRRDAVCSLFKMKSFGSSFPHWKQDIESMKLNGQFSSKSLQLISENLRAVFQGTGGSSRNQSSLSGGGAAWEGMVCWYLNLCLLGTNCVVIKQSKKLLPDPIRKALTVMYGSTPSNTESDLIAITFPESIKAFGDNFKKSEIDEFCRISFSKLQVCVIQCKTNWNDNAQIPMLWDIIYNSAGGIQRATVGIEGYSVENLQRFSYAFVTVPSQKKEDEHKPTSTSVLRVSQLSGGNYWGKATKVGVALTLYEMLTKNFSLALAKLDAGWHRHIDEELSKLNDEYKYFGLN